jgi:hypothetical protein
MFIDHHDHAFHAPGHDGVHPTSFDRRLVANLLVSIYSGVLKEPLPDKIERLVRELEAREAALRDR